MSTCLLFQETLGSFLFKGASGFLMNIFETVDRMPIAQIGSPLYPPMVQTEMNYDDAPLDNGLSIVLPLHIEISPIFNMAGELGISFSSLHGQWDRPARSV